MVSAARVTAFAALAMGFAVASCSHQPTATTTFAIQKDAAPPAPVPPGQDEKKLSAAGNDSDCVLTTGDIRLWCKWITQYY